MDGKFYGITINFANSTDYSRKDYWLCKEVPTLWDAHKTGAWEPMGDDMESLITSSPDKNRTFCFVFGKIIIER